MPAHLPSPALAQTGLTITDAVTPVRRRHDANDVPHKAIMAPYANAQPTPPRRHWLNQLNGLAGGSGKLAAPSSFD